VIWRWFYLGVTHAWCGLQLRRLSGTGSRTPASWLCGG
jgi:hypothetical protein